MDKPLVKSLEDCWAREGQRLKAHLLEVAASAGAPDGTLTEQLDFLAGLLHDAGKARPTWQDYFDRSVRGEPKLETIPHAYFGAALFAVYAQSLLGDRAPPDVVQHYLLLVQDLQDHHGRLRDRTKPPVTVNVPWRDSMKRYPPNDALFGDLDVLVHRFFPSLSTISDYPTFQDHLKRLEQGWARFINVQNMKLRQATSGTATAYAHWICRDVTGRLVAADRLSASALEQTSTTLTTERAREALENFKKKLDEKYRKAIKDGHSVMADKRQRVHEQTLANFLKYPEAPWYTLNLPVGWGKTLTALRIALESAAEGRTERIVYVAPYLAILTQAAKEIRETTGLEVLEHHHLALLSSAPAKDNEGDEKPEVLDILTMESWRAPVVATTFNQLFRAIFPASAQQSIRIPALQKAFVIVDEPQIINAGVYNAFLKGLDVLRERQGARIMLVTATLPPTEHGLASPPLNLTPPVESADRYKLISHAEPWTEEALALKALARLKTHKQVAVILNTIADAVNVYLRIKNELKDADDALCINLHGMMTPLHKACVIATIAERLKAGKPVLVVSTQVLEAGVDLSFRRVLRARPILASVAQAAGRGNRHAEGEIAHIEVFDLLRDSGRDARKLIYRNEQQRRITDELLSAGDEWSETQTGALVQRYFEALSHRDANIEIFRAFKDAAEGVWSRLARLSPFDAAEDDDGNELQAEFNASVFVATAEPEWFDERIRGWMQRFSIEHPFHIYEKYRDKRFLATLSFGDRKRFISLLRQFTAPLRWRLVQQVCGRYLPEKITILLAQDPDAYHLDTGFGHLLSRPDFDDFDRRLEARMTRSHDENMF